MAYQIMKKISIRKIKIRSEGAWITGFTTGLCLCFAKMLMKTFPLTEALGFIVTMCGFWIAKRAVYHHKSFNADLED